MRTNPKVPDGKLVPRRTKRLQSFRQPKIFLMVLLVAVGIHVHVASAVESNKPFVGQWIWSREDEKIFFESREKIQDVMPCIWISTISLSRGKVVQSLAMSPALANAGRPMAFVVRFDDSLHALWNKENEDVIAHDVDSCLARLMKLLNDAGLEAGEIQLDYDCPVRRLSSWAHVVTVISRGSLRGRRIWITSLPAHIADPGYSSLFQRAAAGHILQLFDTGLSAKQHTLDMVLSRLRHQHMPFRIGLAAFERVHGQEITDHEAWFSALSSFEQIPRYKGVWIFPGGKKWLNRYPFVSAGSTEL